ncbi:MAG: DUF1232 domain-containing protein [Candidatus Accumulibacter sp.]|jgi:uncharacterized membrane protein YkvA (DUF1232 family)|nr:DUF1232 domain-containing protein [Accumulibacter sp.]
MTGFHLPLRAKEWAGRLKRQTLVVYFAARDPRTPWPVRLLGLFIAAYALSPIDLIPDFIPILGYLDDLILIPLGFALVMRLIPAPVIESARQRASAAAERPAGFGVAAVIVLIWLLALICAGWWAYRAWRGV